MKNVIAVLGLFLALAPTSQALELQIAPLALEAQAEVLGVRVKVDGKPAIVFAGKAAEIVADAAGIVIDSSVQTVIVTGKDVGKFVNRALRKAHVITGAAVIGTVSFADQALNLVLTDIRQTPAFVINTGREITRFAGAVTGTLLGVSRSGLSLVTETGVRVLRAGDAIIGKVHESACKALKLIGIRVGC